MRAWKYVDPEHQEATAEGCLRLGTWASYLAIENGRADPYDASVAIHTGTVDLGQPDHLDAVIRHGFVNEGAREATFSHVVIKDSSIIHRSPPGYAFCMSEVGTPPFQPTGPQACFEVLAVRTMIRRIHELLEPRINQALLSRMNYRQAEYNVFEPVPPPPSPFAKAPKFAPEREIRAIFLPASGEAPIFVGPDAVIASLLRPVDHTAKPQIKLEWVPNPNRADADA